MASLGSSQSEKISSSVVDRVEDRRLRRGAGGNVSVYYYVGDAYRDMLVAVGFHLGSIVCIIAFAAFGQITVLTACISVLFKILAASVCYVATAKHSGKVMIFAAICSGLGVAVSGYVAITSFINWASKDFSGVGIPLIVQGILELLVYGHMTYYAITLL
ncbi:unnamed protein product [Cylicocyclus nassatus]|uniref:Uncharacterized protein n=1 Tax=Cylicocyclus nassatus TaxID=53992 RepID=A0AA36M217_CYLNA|nr:unnamed protein product [Cylicocyclus nassatus]